MESLRRTTVFRGNAFKICFQSQFTELALEGLEKSRAFLKEDYSILKAFYPRGK